MAAQPVRAIQGSSRFYVSLQDDLMRIFASERISSLLKRFGMEDGMAIEHSMVSRSIERAQKKVEAHNFEIRKHLLDYDEVMDQQRKTIYSLRQDVLEGKNLREYITRMIDDCIEEMVAVAFDTKHRTEEEEPFDIASWFKLKFGLEIDLNEVMDKTRGNVEAHLKKKAMDAYEAKKPSWRRRGGKNRTDSFTGKDRHQVEGSPLCNGSPEVRHRSPGLCADRP